MKTFVIVHQNRTILRIKAKHFNIVDSVVTFYGSKGDSVERIGVHNLRAGHTVVEELAVVRLSNA